MADPQDNGQQAPLFDMSKATPIQQPAQGSAPLFDMSKAQPIQGAPTSQPQVTNTAGETMPADVAARHARSREGHEYGTTTLAQTMGQVLPGGETATNVATGFAKEAAKTGFGAARLVGGDGAASTVAPEDLETKGVAQGVGGVVEQGGEWIAGDEALKGFGYLSKVLKNAPHMIQILEEFPKASKAIMALAPVAKAAAIGGAQGAVKESAPGGEGAAAGAKHGAEGGAAGGALGEIAGAVAKPILNKMGLATSAEEDIMRAAQPGKRNTKFIEDWGKAAPRLVKEIEAGGKFTDMDDAANRIRDVRQGIWNDEVKPAIEAHKNEIVDTTSVAKAVRDLADPSTKAGKTLSREFPEDAKKLTDFSDKYMKGSPLFAVRSVEDLEQEIELYNGKLSEKGFWKKSASEKAALIKANPEIAAWKTASDAMRDNLYDHLENVSGVKGMKDLKQTYGAVANVENEIRGQVNVASRQKPLSLKQIIGLTAGIVHGGPGGWAAAALPVIDKLYNSPEALLNRAVSKTAPGPVKQVVQKATNAVAKNAANIGGFTGEQGVLMLGPNGPVMMHHEDVDKAQQMGYKQVESSPDNK